MTNRTESKMDINLGNVHMAEPQRFSRNAISERVAEFTGYLRDAVEQDRVRQIDATRMEAIRVLMMPGTARELLDGLQALMAEAGRR